MEPKNSFEYLGLHFMPCREFTKGEKKQRLKKDLRLSNLNGTPDGWNWNEFYKTAERELGKKGVVDVYLVDGEERVPGTNYLFYLSPLKEFAFKNITTKTIIIEEIFSVKHVNSKEAQKLAKERIQKEDKNRSEKQCYDSRFNTSVETVPVKTELYYVNEQQNTKSIVWKTKAHDTLKDSLENLFDSNLKVLDKENMNFCLSFNENIFWFCSPDKKHLEKGSLAQKLIEEYDCDINSFLSDQKEYDVLRNTLLKAERPFMEYSYHRYPEFEIQR